MAIRRDRAEMVPGAESRTEPKVTGSQSLALMVEDDSVIGHDGFHAISSHFPTLPSIRSMLLLVLGQI